MTSKAFWLSLVAIFLGGSTEVGMAFWLPAYAEKTLGYTAEVAGLGLMGFTLAMTLGRLGIVALPKTLPPVTLMLWCCVLTVLLFAAGSFVPHSGLALSACIAAGLTGSCLWPSVLAVTADRFPAGGATMFALLAAMGNAGATFMPWLIGGVADHSNMRLALATAGLCPLLMIGVLLAMGRRPVALPAPAV
jgi:fucose permease